MMIDVYYASPVWESLDEHVDYYGDPNPASRESTDYLFEQDESYWQNAAGCGHGTFELAQRESVFAQLAITLKAGVGYWICITLPGNPSLDSYLAVNESQRPNEWVELRSCGETEKWPAVFFHTQQRSRSIVRDFLAMRNCSDAHLPKSIGWVTCGEADVDTASLTFNQQVVADSRNYN